MVGATLLLAGCVVWQPYAALLEPPPYAEHSPAYPTQVECNRRAFHAVKHTCYREHKKNVERYECILKTEPFFRCIPRPCPRGGLWPGTVDEGPEVDPEVMPRVGGAGGGAAWRS